MSCILLHGFARFNLGVAETLANNNGARMREAFEAICKIKERRGLQNGTRIENDKKRE